MFFFYTNELILLTYPKKDILRLPLQLIHFRLQSPLIYIYSPIGSFALHFKDGFAEIIQSLYQIRVSELNPYVYGQSSFQTDKNKLYQCCIRYLGPGMKYLGLKFLTVKAGNENECLDICHSFILNILSQPPQVFMVSSRELITGKDIIMC